MVRIEPSNKNTRSACAVVARNTLLN